MEGLGEVNSMGSDSGEVGAGVGVVGGASARIPLRSLTTSGSIGKASDGSAGFGLDSNFTFLGAGDFRTKDACSLSSDESSAVRWQSIPVVYPGIE